MIWKKFEKWLHDIDHQGFTALKGQVVGHGKPIATPFGSAPLVYADYTASGRALTYIEETVAAMLADYANTHTEDDHSGLMTTRGVEKAETLIRQALRAGNDYTVLPCGTGATGAIDKLQRILGIAISPLTRERLLASLPDKSEGWQRLVRQSPVVFVGPYEHHSNDVTWRQGLCEVVAIGLDAQGHIDLQELERELQRPEFRNRIKIGSFSAASNVTGLRTPARKIACLLHRHGAIACFDFAAAGPYVDIDLTTPFLLEGEDASFDAIYLSPHKFLGGPGASGLLVLKNHLYRQDLPPTVSAGGTVSFVSSQDHDFLPGIAIRENGGTPGILQMIRTGLAMELKRRLTPKAIEAREAAYLDKALRIWRADPRIVILGDPDPAARIAIVSFNIKDPIGQILHPKLVARLLNDLFGIQSRAGCSCAGPYGHALLQVDDAQSEHYRSAIAAGQEGLKPGWCRIGLHYALDPEEIDYIIRAVKFVATFGARFIRLYKFDLKSGQWRFAPERSLRPWTLSRRLGEAAILRRGLRARMAYCERRAQKIADGLREISVGEVKQLERSLEPLRYFNFMLGHDTTAP